MADPKYDGLPGIVYDQPDVYETSELPESEQDIQEIEAEESSSSYEILHISGQAAYEKFKGKSVNTSDIDFSDRISKHRRTGYMSNRPIEWNIIGDSDDETVVQKYQRLQCEMNDLQQEVQQLQGSVKHGDGNVSVVDLSKCVDELHSTLRTINLEETLGKDTLSIISEPEVALEKKLINLLENLKQTGIVSEKRKGDSPTGKVGSGITYELYYAPENVKLNQMARASQLEKRLDKLESLIGNNPDKMSSLSTWTNSKSLLGAVGTLSCRLSLLEPSHLDHIEGRLHSIHTRMNSIAEKKTAVEDSDKQSKINELYEIMKKCEVLCSALPEVVDRLTSVENLHQEATQFSRSLKQLDATQTELTATLQTNSVLLSTVQEKLFQNLTTIQNNIKSLEDRIQKLQKK